MLFTYLIFDKYVSFMRFFFFQINYNMDFVPMYNYSL